MAASLLYDLSPIKSQELRPRSSLTLGLDKCCHFPVREVCHLNCDTSVRVDTRNSR